MADLSKIASRHVKLVLSLEREYEFRTRLRSIYLHQEAIAAWYQSAL